MPVMQLRDWMSGLLGLIVFALGLLPLIDVYDFSFVPIAIFKWVIAIAGLFMVQDAVVEITNSNVLGWATLWVSLGMLIVGLLPILHGFGIGPDFFELSFVGRTFYNILFLIEGLFLMIATFAREL